MKQFCAVKTKKFLRWHNEVKSFEFLPEIVKIDENILWKQCWMKIKACLCFNQATSTINYQIYRYFPWLAILSFFITNNSTMKKYYENI